MPQASRRSVFTSEALSAARTCRVSMSTVSRPRPDRPVCNHSDMGPASSPTRSGACGANAAAIASGSVVTEPSKTTWPWSSTTQIAVVASDTSSPAKRFITVILQSVPGQGCQGLSPMTASPKTWARWL
jgi:hypothetical protein